jgi:GNAT superfamily N-acetyltransferase
MNANYTTPRVVIRPTLPSDTPDVLEFCKYIWEGNDYIPYVWNEWMADPRGTLFTAEYAGHAVGIARVTHLAPKQWWFEGLRVNPDFHDKKIGSALHEYITEWWLENGDGTVRLWTNAKRVKVHHLCKKLGFVHTQEVTFYAAAPRDEPVDSFAPAIESQIPEMTEFTLRSPSLPLAGGMMDMGWQPVVPDEVTFRGVLSRGEGAFLWWRGRRGLVGLWEDDDEKGMHPMVGLAACEVPDLTELLLDVRRLTARDGRHKVVWNACLTPELDAILLSAGFSRESDHSNYQFEKIHPTRP